MTTPAHTPGPWRVEPWVYENGKRTVLTIQTDTDAIAQVLDLWCPDDRASACEANARLIASAPALARENAEMRQELSALASILDGLVASMDMRSGFAQQTQHRVETARALLARI